MGFADFLTDAGCSNLGSQLEATVSDGQVKDPLELVLTKMKFLEFSSLPGDPSKAYTTYGPEKTEGNLNPKDAPKAVEADEEDDDLFGSDDESEDEDAKKKREENLAAYKKKKEGKTKPAAKSIVTMDVKPWDDETDMKELEQNLRAIEIDGLTWGASTLVPLAFGIKKLQVNLVVEDEKVSIDDLQQQIESDEDHVQSTDVVSSPNSLQHT
ncbi:MAG: hypothetical protein Q9194_000479 [Teloschistes cf. exilis]